MKLIIITSPVPVAGEAHIIAKLVSYGVYRIHLRRPTSSIDEFRTLLSSLPEECLRHAVLHDHHELANEFPVRGLHLNYRNPMPPADFNGQISRSTHSFQELQKYKDECDYFFLSPIFDSISKQGLRAAFTQDELCTASEKGIINEKVFALGGITIEKERVLKELGFGGAALLGDFWSKVANNQWQDYLNHWKAVR